MKTLFFTSLSLTLVLALSGCAPSASQLKRVMEDNPEILFSVIEKNPDKFMETLDKAVQVARKKQQERMNEDEEKGREDEFKNPKVPTIADNRAIYGNKSAPITIIEYSDFECPFCSRGYNTIKEVEKEYGDKIRVVYKHLPLDFHPKAEPAARFFEAIVLQSPEKAYKWHDEMFKNQDKFKEQGDAYMKKVAKDLGLNLGKIEKDAKSSTVADIIKADMEEARKFGFQGTPGFLINGVSLKGAYPFSEFKKIIDRQLEAKK